MTLKSTLILSTTIKALYIDGEAGAELRLEYQENGQGTPGADMKACSMQNLSVGSSTLKPTLPFFHFTVQQLCILIAERILMEKMITGHFLLT